MKTTTKLKRIAYTPGEPGGIGADLILMLAQEAFEGEIVVFGCAEHLDARAHKLGLKIQLHPVDFNKPVKANGLGHLSVFPIPLAKPLVMGHPDASNRNGVLKSLSQAFDACIEGLCQALVTGPVQKSVLSSVHEPFHGHTEFFAQCAAHHQGATLNLKPTLPEVTMAFYHPSIVVGLATTHIPLHQVPQSITPELIQQRCEHLNQALNSWFHLANPRIGILGINPHAGEAGQIGQEEVAIIQPTIKKLQQQGINVTGPIPGDSAFLPDNLKQFDALLAMYHDQGLGPLKTLGFGDVVNITLGLPIVRTSVDHGTALPLAGSGRANPQGLRTALNLALTLC